MKHIKTWEERVPEGASIYAKAVALEFEVAELRQCVNILAGLLASKHYGQYSTNEEKEALDRSIELALNGYDIGAGRYR